MHQILMSWERLSTRSLEWYEEERCAFASWFQLLPDTMRPLEPRTFPHHNNKSAQQTAYSHSLSMCLPTWTCIFSGAKWVVGVDRLVRLAVTGGALLVAGRCGEWRGWLEKSASKGRFKSSGLHWLGLGQESPDKCSRMNLEDWQSSLTSIMLNLLYNSIYVEPYCQKVVFKNEWIQKIGSQAKWASCFTTLYMWNRIVRRYGCCQFLVQEKHSGRTHKTSL